MAARQVQVLFVGIGASAISWYRIVLPAMYLGCDWMGVTGEPPKLRFATGYVKGDTKMARFEDYDLVVVQQPRGHGWFALIGELQSRGIKVLIDIDDYVHGIRKSPDHEFKANYDRKTLALMELCMRRADGLICSTAYLAGRYRQINPRSWVCPNGLDMARYRLSRPQRPTIDGKPIVTIMWAGGTGHERSLAPWLQTIEDAMFRHDHIRFCSIGLPVARPFQAVFGMRALAIPFGSVESYPAAMTIGDVALAPGGTSSFYRAKSALRAIEAGALGIPVLADPKLYGEVVIDGETGFLVDTPAGLDEHLELLIQDDSLRLRMGDRARAHVQEHFDMRVVVEHWKRAIIGALDGTEA